MKALRVLFDTTWATGTGGTARYVRSLAVALAAEPGVVIITVRAPRLSTGPRLIRLLLNGSIHLAWTQLAFPLLAVLRKADIVHTSMTAPIVSPKPVVLTLHDALDFIPALRPSRVWSAYMQTFGAVAARRAAAVLTGTRASAAEIARYYRLKPDRVHTTPYGSALASGCATGNPLESPFVLMVGAADRRKDLQTGLKAVEAVRTNGIALTATIVGSVPERYRDAKWVTVLTGVSDDELARLYTSALAVIVPSRHEGFGLPVVEALAFGTPVIASDLPALREAGGAAARYAPAGDAAAFARELQAIVDNPIAARQAIGAAPTGRVTRWTDTARTTTAIYRELLGADR